MDTQDMPSNLTAIVIGATGLVGNALVQQLITDEQYGRIVILHRRSIGIHHPKLEVHIVNFDQPDTWRDLVKGDVLFSAMGTTLRKAGSKAAQYQVDFTYQYEVAKAASANQVPQYVLVSAAMAKPTSPFFYAKMKGQLEAAITTLSFQYIHIFQPGLLTGERKERRRAEEWSAVILGWIAKIPLLGHWRPISGEEVARAMRAVVQRPLRPVLRYPNMVLLKLGA